MPHPFLRATTPDTTVDLLIHRSDGSTLPLEVARCITGFMLMETYAVFDVIDLNRSRVQIHCHGQLVADSEDPKSGEMGVDELLAQLIKAGLWREYTRLAMEATEERLEGVPHLQLVKIASPQCIRDWERSDRLGMGLAKRFRRRSDRV